MPTLYELTDDIKFVLQLADSENADESLTEALDNLQGAFQKKAENIAVLVQELLALSVSRTTEAKRMQDRANVALNSAKRAKEYLRENMESCGMQSLETERFRITRCKNGGKSPLDLIDDQVPTDYRVEKTVSTVDTERIRKELESGSVLKFARFSDRGEHLKIK